MRLITCLAVWAVLSLVPARAHSEGVRSRELRVLAYDGMQELAPALFGAFEEHCRCRVRVRTAGDAAQMLSLLQLESLRGKARTQIVVGIDQTLWQAASPLAEDLGVRFERVPEIGPALPGFVPLDWGIQSLMVSDAATDAVLPPRLSWRALTMPEYQKKFILQDPRTSTPGLGFVWGAVRALKGDGGAAGYFSRLRSQWLTLAPGWTGAYGLFLKGRAPLVWSYTTSQAYHAGRGSKGYRAIVFEEGNPIQIEGAFAVRSALASDDERRLAREFLEFMVSARVQREIPARQWMFPVLKGVALPQSFADLPQPVRILRWEEGALDLKQLIRDWEGWIAR